MKIQKYVALFLTLIGIACISTPVLSGNTSDCHSADLVLYDTNEMSGKVNNSLPFIEWLKSSYSSFGGSIKSMRKIEKVRLMEIEVNYQIRYDYQPPHVFRPIIKDTRTEWERISDYESAKVHLISEGFNTVDVAGIAYCKGLYYENKRPIVWVIDSTFQMITGYKKNYWIKHKVVEAYLGNPEDIDAWHTILLPDSMGDVRRMTLSEDFAILHEWFHPDAEIFKMRPVIIYLDLLSKPSYTYEWWMKRKKTYGWWKCKKKN